MSIQLVAAAVFFCIAMSGIMCGSMVVFMMIGEINRRRPNDDTLKYFGFELDRIGRVTSEYRSLYPHGRLHVVLRGSLTVGFVSLACCTICFLFRLK